MYQLQAFKNRRTAEANLWRSRVVAAGGGFESNSLVLANNFVLLLQRKSYYVKVKYLLPLLGAGIGAAQVPLIDVLNVGIATNTNFVNSDFSQSTGLQGDGSTKYLDSLIKPSQLGTSTNGGLGFWENNISFGSNVEPIGCYNTAANNRYVLDLRSNLRAFRWGNAGNGASDAVAATNGNYYGQRLSATSRTVYFNGSLLATNSTNDTTAGASDQTIQIVGSNEAGTPAPWPGRCAVAYMTDGTMTTDEVGDLDSLLRNYLLGPTGKPMS